MSTWETQPAEKLPARVAGGRGWRWLVEAFWLVRKQPLSWVAMAAGYLLIHFLVARIPMVGAPLTFFMAPVFAGGFVLQADRAARGETVKMAGMFDGFRLALRPLLNVGMLYLGLMMLAMLVLGVIGGAMGITVQGEGGPEGLPQLGGPVLAFMLVTGALMFVLGLCYWFAPALVTLDGMGAWEAVRLSLKAGLVNWRAVLFSGLMLSLMLFLALLPLGLGLLLWFPVLYVTAFTGWRDVFGGQPVLPELVVD